MTLYKLLLFVHIASIATWTGGNLMYGLLARRAAKLGPPQPEMVVRNLETAEWLGPHFYMPLMGLTLASGIWLIIESGMGFGHFFIWFGLGMVVLSGGLGGAFFGPKAKQIVAHINEKGLDAEVQAGLGQIMMVSKTLLALLFLTILVMVIKPFS